LIIVGVIALIIVAICMVFRSNKKVDPRIVVVQPNPRKNNIVFEDNL